jgi:hypothetical protein
VLASMDVERIQECLIALVQQLIRNKKFSRYLISGCSPIAIVATQKLQRDWVWTEKCWCPRRNLLR